MMTNTITNRDGHELAITVPQQGDDMGEVMSCQIDGRPVTWEEAQAFIDSYWKSLVGEATAYRKLPGRT
jgi:hypothetical protein